MNSKYFDGKKQEKALKWLEEKWPKEKQNCEICGSKSWTLADDLVTPILFIGGELSIGGVSYPHVLITCNGCGNAKFFNAIIAGVLRATGGING